MPKKLTYKRIISWYRLQYVSGDLGLERLRIIGGGIGVAVIIAVALGLLYGVATKGSAELCFTEKIARNSKDILEAVLGFITICAAVYASLQVRLMKEINRTEMCHEIYKADQEYRKKSKLAKEKLNELVAALGENVDETKFQDVYQDQVYEELRSFAYHYEYIGYLTLRRKLDFDVAFDTITYPNWLINSDDAKKLIAIGRRFTPDFWSGSEYLYYSYEVRRAYSYRKKHRGTDEAEGRYKAACKKWMENYEFLI